MIDFFNARSKIETGYFELLDTIDARLEEPTLAGFEGLHYQVAGRRYWIRHDVDDRIDIAWEMAEAEAERGIRAAYFFLHTAPYFRWGAFLDIARDFVKAGHTIGMHNNAISAAMRNGDDALAEKMLKRDLAYLRKAGDIWITASHGDLWNRLNKTPNYEMFTECRRNGCCFKHKPLAHYGLKYEVYFTPYDFYLSDSGSVWSTCRDINVSLSADIPKGGNPADTIGAFNKTENGILQILVHPQWWEKRRVDAVKAQPLQHRG
jgi:hypothetical protein